MAETWAVTRLRETDAAWSHFHQHIEEEDPRVQDWLRVDPYAVRMIFRAGFVAGHESSRQDTP